MKSLLSKWTSYSKQGVLFGCSLLFICQPLKAELSAGPNPAGVCFSELHSFNDLPASFNQSLSKAGTGELTLQGESTFQGTSEVGYGILVFNEPPYDPLRDPRYWFIMRDDPPILVTNDFPLVSQPVLPLLEASGSAIPEHSTTGILFGLLTLACALVIRRKRAMS